MDYNEFVCDTARNIFIKYDLKNNPPIVVAKKAIEYAKVLADELKTQGILGNNSTIEISTEE